ncbi:hypothetical protein BHE74_00013262 [Ensete ventricosum]|uniref:Uncharacterized protein n=1 Tax=Ensete ventricosum TaxID=4639 RepID=A0A427ANQ2_ENSVE|nr:hypothetical protein B296_00022528 [Ensete ventricosum]RWW06765.1 hypothetical protein GW17_00029881 [Ensete ventricosum]RWW78511.1 hypothetical protein BHE74_00013262 [Ensete ventricosum]
MGIFETMAASSFPRLSSLLVFVGFLSLLRPCACYRPMNSSDTNLGTSPAIATWYGSAAGAGSTGNVRKKFLHYVTPVTVVITDQCPGGPCDSDPVHFDLSGTAFGDLAKPGQANALRSAGSIHVQYTSYPGVHITFRVDNGSNPNFFAVLPEYVGGDGELSAVEVQDGAGPWRPMQISFGAVWKLNSGTPVRGPLSLRLTAGVSRKTLVAPNVIPVGWRPGATYNSNVNF